MGSNQMGDKTGNLHSQQAINTEGNAKSFYQYFTVYIIAIFLIVIIVHSSVLFLLSQQSEHSQALITEQIVPLQTQFLQQTYLINTNNLIDDILHNINVDEFVTLQQKLLLQSKQLLLLKSDHKRSYQQWFANNNLATHIVTRIKSNHASNEILKKKSLIQLDTLLDAIKIQLNIPSDKQQQGSAQAELLSTVENQLTSIVIMLKRLSLQMPLSEFKQLRNRIDEVFTADYAKELAEQQLKVQGMADIVRDLIRFEDLILKRGVLDKWQEHLRLIDGYQQQLILQQQQLQIILHSLLKEHHEVDTRSNVYITANKHAIKVTQLSKWAVIIFAFALFSIAGLLWLIRRRMLSAVACIEHVLESKNTPLITNRNEHYKAEVQPLISKVQQIDDNNSELAYQALVDKNQALEEQILKDKATQEQLALDFEILKLDASVKDTSQLLLEQQHYSTLNLVVIKQLVLLGQSAVTATINSSNEYIPNVENNYLHQIYLQSLDLVKTLRQASSYRYLQRSDALLTLSDVNFVAQIQAIALNFHHELYRCKNSVLVSIDEKILSEVNLDVELFADMVAAFIRLLFSQQTDKQLALHLQLVDKNNGQQTICFSGQIKGAEKIVQLPQALQGFHDESIENNELGNYFNTLLKFQHGGDINVKITDKSYQLSFTLPLAVANNQQGQYYPVLSLPGCLTDIESVCTKLASKYFTMPIEVLLAVKIPAQYQRLQQLLQGIGLQVTFVTDEVTLQKNWQSGRFLVLITEIACQPFINFIVDEKANRPGRDTLIRGVFSLANVVNIRKKAQGCSHWIIGELNANIAIGELIMAMQPWIKEQAFYPSLSQQSVQYNASKELANARVPAVNLPVSFNIERYIKHQGSAELAIFMLDEYTAENASLVEKLSHAFRDDDAKQADTVIQALLINSKILAADYLVHLCQHWQKLLTNQALDSCNKVQLSLLSKTKKAVLEVSKHADVVA